MTLPRCPSCERRDLVDYDVDEREYLCVRCGERLSRHLYATSTEHGEAYICPHVLSAHTFAQVK